MKKHTSCLPFSCLPGRNRDCRGRIHATRREVAPTLGASDSVGGPWSRKDFRRKARPDRPARVATAFMAVRGPSPIVVLLALSPLLYALCPEPYGSGIRPLLYAQSGVEIIEAVDRNTVVSSASYRAKMVISLGGRIREKEFAGYVEGKERAYMEFLAPARDEGTRFLKIGSEMWMYLPSVEKATKIAGHMLRQSLMGSDFSYDDMTENKKLTELYGIELMAIDTILGKECYKLELTAKVEEVTYYRRISWIDREFYVPVKSELYARSGKLLKEITIGEFEQIGTHNYPTKVRMVNKLRKDTYTELVLEDIELDVKIPERIFTKSYLERK